MRVVVLFAESSDIPVSEQDTGDRGEGRPHDRCLQAVAEPHLRIQTIV
jgi:hypothetical protein